MKLPSTRDTNTSFIQSVFAKEPATTPTSILVCSILLQEMTELLVKETVSEACEILLTLPGACNLEKGSCSCDRMDWEKQIEELPTSLRWIAEVLFHLKFWF